MLQWWEKGTEPVKPTEIVRLSPEGCGEALRWGEMC